MKKLFAIILILFWAHSGVAQEIKNPVLKIEKLKSVQHGRYTKVDVRVTNSSSAFIEFLHIDFSIYDSSNTYQGKGFLIGKNYKPGESKTERLILSDIQVENVKKWEPKIGSVKVEIGSNSEDKSKIFSVKEK